MKFTFVLLFCLYAFTNCNMHRIKNVTLIFYNLTGSTDSVFVIEKNEIEVLQKYLVNKKEISEKIPAKYILRINYVNGISEEYSCNGFILKSDATYINSDTTMQKKYLQVINSKLPKYLQQQ